MSFIKEFYPESKYGGFTNLDGTVSFYWRVNSILNPSSIVLDAGCGRGAYLDDPVESRRKLRTLRGKVARVIGIDVDPAARSNPGIDEFRAIDGDAWPIEDDSVDLVLCDNVLEHLPSPDILFHEAQRVLRCGGVLCIRTPNARNYISIFSRIIPHKYHARITRAVQDDRMQEDVFPAYYHCNTIQKIRRMLRKHAFGDCVVYGYEAEPSYLSFSRFAYWLGVIHQKNAPRGMRATILAFGRKSCPEKMDETGR